MQKTKNSRTVKAFIYKHCLLSSLLSMALLTQCMPKQSVSTATDSQQATKAVDGDQSAQIIPSKPPATVPQPSQVSSVRFKRMITVILENTGFNQAAQQPFLAALAKQGALMTNFNGETHPSQGNYIAMVSGNLQGVTGNGNYDIDALHIGDLLDKKNLSWKVYAEGYPGNCYTKKKLGKYVRKHNPMISFNSITKNPQRCANIVNADEFEGDAKQGKLANFIQYIPDLNNDGHDTGVAFASKWLETKFGSYLKDPVFMQETLFVLTFDENEGSKPNQIYTVMYGPMVVAGAQSNALYDHYSLLKLAEDNWELGNLKSNDVTAAAMTGFWK
ncbi:MAG: alkaline phosphatase family protein [Pseudobdellovibrio sp.]